jgi:hypothetical protein
MLFFVLFISTAAGDTTCGARQYKRPVFNSCYPCPLGHYCTATDASTTTNRCPSGTYNPREGSNSSDACLPCEAGRVSAFSGSAQCSPCAAGTFSLSSTTCRGCPLGLASAAGSPACSACPAGTAFVSEAQCSPCTAGNFSVSAANATCTPCAAGLFSAAGSATCSAECPAGSYAGASPYCLACPAGTQQPSLGATSVSVCADCAAGFFSAPGSPNCTACAVSKVSGVRAAVCGATCPDGTGVPSPSSSACLPCPVGTWALSSASCKPCAAGKFAATPGTAECSVCAAEQYSSEGASACNYSITTCPKGTSPTPPSSCLPCAAGKAALSGQLCVTCPAGMYSSTAGASVCSSCPAGRVSTTPGATSCSLCGEGLTSSGNGASCLGCPSGTTSSAGGACTRCPAGNFSVFEIRSPQSPTLCKPCLSTAPFSTADGASCVAACLAGTRTLPPSSCIACLPGEGSEASSLACTACAAGKYSNGGTACKPCSTGSFSAFPNASACSPCPAGSVSTSVGAQACQQCPAGQVPSANRASCSNCLGGYAPSANGSSCWECPANTFAVPGSPACSQCAPTTASLSGALVCCAAGYWAAPGSSVCSPCPAGTASAAAGATSPVVCQPCPAQTFSPPGAPACQACAAGRSSGAGAGACCQPGAVAGAAAATRFGGSATACYHCAPNFYCPNVTTALPCPPNTFSPQGSMDPSACQPCPSGLLQPPSYFFQLLEVATPGSASPSASATRPVGGGGAPAAPPASAPLPLAMCCPAGANGYNNCSACPAGTFSNATSTGQCAPCPQGTYSATPGSTRCTSCPMGTWGQSTGGYSYNNPGYTGGYGLISSALCTVCTPPPRYGCLSEGCYVMSGEWKCIPGATSGGGVFCPSGYWCPGGTSAASAPQPCPLGTYLPDSGALSNQCLQCPGMLTTLQPGAPNASACVCPPGASALPGSSPPACTTTASAAASAAPPPPPSPWAQFQAVLIPLLTVLGALATYATVGDRVLAACAPALHARLWRGVAGWMAHAAAPACRRARWCPARGAEVLEGAAAGILKGLADLAEARQKTALAQKALTSMPGGGAANGSGSGSGSGAGSAGGGGALATVGNPLRGGSGGSAAPAPPHWHRHSDGMDTWYSNAATGEVAWDLPAGAALVGEEGAGGGGGTATDSPSGVVWQRHSDDADVWYTSSEGETAWALPSGAVLRQ